MKVLQLAAKMLSLERFALPLMQRLRDDGFHVEAMGQFDGHELPIQEADFPTHDWDAGHTFNPLRLIGARRKLRKFLRNRDFNIVHSHCSFGGILGNPVAQNLASHVIYTQHGFYVHEGLNPLIKRVWLRVEKIGLEPADHVLCVSEAEQKLARSLDVGPPDKFVHVPGAGIDTDRFELPQNERLKRRQQLRNEFGLSDDQTVLLTVSRLTHDKGYQEMIDATRLLRDEGYRFVLLAAGSGKDEASIRRTIAKTDLENTFRLLGWRDDIADLYSAADIFVFASHREGLPIAPIEAMASGLPVVLSDIPGCREEVKEGESGLLFETNNSEDLAKCVAKLIDNIDFRRNISAAARDRAQVFDIENVLDRQQALYREIAALQ